MVPTAAVAVRFRFRSVGESIFGMMFPESTGFEIPFLKPALCFCHIPRLRAGRSPAQIGITEK